MSNMRGYESGQIRHHLSSALSSTTCMSESSAFPISHSTRRSRIFFFSPTSIIDALQFRESACSSMVRTTSGGRLRIATPVRLATIVDIGW